MTCPREDDPDRLRHEAQQAMDFAVSVLGPTDSVLSLADAIRRYEEGPEGHWEPSW